MSTRRHLLLSLLTLLSAAASAPAARAADAGGRHVYIRGEVKMPGAFPWQKGITVREAIQRAGGFTEAANRSRALLTRAGREIVLSREDLAGPEPREPLTLEPDDVIYVDRGGIRVEGEVRSPGDYGPEHARVREALIAAGGPTPMADLEAVYIARGGQVIRVDGHRALAGGAGAPNPDLEPGDVIHVPRAEQRVTITGEVRTPGAYTLAPGTLERLADLIAAAGGPTAWARASRVALHRPARAGEKPRVQIINLEDPGLDEVQRNPVLQAGDHVVVPARRTGRGFSIQDAYQVGILIATILALVLR
ncbi:MAG: SLBB domain-containing protein [Armatimonadetes bacterium]|nr:SLBB domain-containing protein [Armatimonadota bacterium]